MKRQYALHSVHESPDEAVAAVRAWSTLDAAFSSFNRHLQRCYGVTGTQLAMLRLLAEWDEVQPAGVAVADVRSRLSLHPATAGQLLDRLAVRGLLDLVADRSDRRRRRVVLTHAARKLLAEAPIAGPERLQHVTVDAARLQRLGIALNDALDLFGLRDYLDGPTGQQIV